MESSESDQQYPYELLEAHRVENGRLYTPVDIVFEALEELLVERERLIETGAPYSMGRIEAYGDFIGSMDQEDLYQAMEGHSNSTVAAAAVQIDSDYSPQTRSTFEYLVSMTQEAAPRFMST